MTDATDQPDMRDAMPFMKLLDMEVVTNTADEVRVRMAWRAAVEKAGAMCAGKRVARVTQTQAVL